MTKKIILLSDGTGNAAAKVWRSNVWRLFESLDLTKPNQVAIYDDGVGTASFKPLALIGGAFGWGLKRNVIELYTFLCRNYEAGAEIFGFGFSRGAFTMRIVAGLVVNQGVISAKLATGEVDLQRLARAAYRAYRAQRFHSILRVEGPLRWVRDRLLSLVNKLRRRKAYDPALNRRPDIRFLGLWDTVAAYGLPIDEMTRGFSQWIWPLEFPDRVLSPKVLRACHGLALDDERTTFHPMLWTEAGEPPAPVMADGYRYVKDERLSQVWFAGTHANVGGGYPDDRLAHVPLVWIMRQAEFCGLEFKKAPENDPDAIRHARSAADKDGRLYDSRHGLAGYYRYGPRKITELCAPHYTPVLALLARLLRAKPKSLQWLFSKKDVVEIAEPKIHYTAIERMNNGAFAYAPIGFPPSYAVVDAWGRILTGGNSSFERPDDAKARAAAQERVWNWVWGRRVIYFLTLGASIHLALVPVLYEIHHPDEFASRLPLVSRLVRLAGGFLPGVAQWWIDAFAAGPVIFLSSLLLVVVLMLTGIYLGARVSDEMRGVWHIAKDQQDKWANSPPLPPPPTDRLFRMRRTNAYRSLFWLLKRAVLPLLSAMLILYLGLAFLNNLAFTSEDGWGLYCKETERSQTIPVAVGPEREFSGFDTRQVCWPSRVWLDERGRYELTLTMGGLWNDSGSIPSGIDGFELREVPGAMRRGLMLVSIPLRRKPWQPWFRPIARIGAQGADEYPLDPEARGTVQMPGQKEVTFMIRPRHAGELFLYVNDAVIGIPGLENSFYLNNEGTATLKVKRLR